MRFRWACITLCAAQFWGCENPRPVLTHVDPGQAYSDADVRLTLVGEGFIPATTLDPSSGSRVTTMDGFHVRVGKDPSWAELADLAWQSTGQMTGTLLSQQASANTFPTGDLDVEVTDPRGQRAVLEQGFLELGPDLTPPTVVFTNPPAITPVGPGTLLTGSFHASDALPGTLHDLGWTYVEDGNRHPRVICPTPQPTAEADCAFQIKVSQTLVGGEHIQIVADATDASAGRNQATATLEFTVLAMPRVATIFPISGGTAGGTDIVITGTGFIHGSQAVLDGTLLFPNGGIVIDENTLSGHVPAHDKGSTSIFVHTPIGIANGVIVFTYLPPPFLGNITPSTGAGGTAVVLTGKDFTADTQIYFGSTLDSAIPLAQLFLQSDSTIIGLLPMGIGQTTVWAFDKELGFTRLPNGFTWSNP